MIFESILLLLLLLNILSCFSQKPSLDMQMPSPSLNDPSNTIHTPSSVNAASKILLLTPQP